MDGLDFFHRFVFRERQLIGWIGHSWCWIFSHRRARVTGADTAPAAAAPPSAPEFSKARPMPSLALRAELRGYATLINSSGSFFCSGGCVVSLKGDALVQGAALLGLSMRF